MQMDFVEVVLDLLLLNTIILPTSPKPVSLKFEIIQISYRTALIWLYAIQRCADPENEDVPMSCSLQALRLWMIRICGYFVLVWSAANLLICFCSSCSVYYLPPATRAQVIRYPPGWRRFKYRITALLHRCLVIVERIFHRRRLVLSCPVKIQK